MESGFSLDALVPREMANKAETVGVAKATLGPLRMLALAVLAGAFIALGAIFATTATAGTSGEIPLAWPNWWAASSSAWALFWSWAPGPNCSPATT